MNTRSDLENNKLLRKLVRLYRKAQHNIAVLHNTEAQHNIAVLHSTEAQHNTAEPHNIEVLHNTAEPHNIEVLHNTAEVVVQHSTEGLRSTEVLQKYPQQK